MKRAILRFLVWLRDSLPMRSNRDCARAWLQGVELGKREIGLTRDARGRWKQISP